MTLSVSALGWLILAAGVGISALFIFGIRMVVARMTAHSRPSTIPQEIVIPAPRITSGRQAARTVALLLWVGAGFGLILLRYTAGLGAVSHLSDRFPWGLWIGLDVMGGVALAAGGFVIAAIAHIFKVERFKPLARPAILTGLLGYLLVIGGLMVDLGRPYNVWQPLVHWQHHSVMWEVGLCVATYTTVLIIEFLPVILERLNQFPAITRRLPSVPLYRLLKKVSIAFVIAGVVLSTLHQSSLGSLWVLIPTKLSPIWYSIYLPVFFWLSAVAVGLAMTIVEATLSARAFKRGLERRLLAELGTWAAIVLAVYLVARLADLIARGAWPLVLQPNLQAVAWWVEMGLGVVAPMVLFAVKPLRQKSGALFGGAALVVLFGVVLNRLNVSWIGLLPYTGAIYVPSVMEVVVTATLVSIGVVAFGLAARYLPVFPAVENSD